MKIEKLPWGSPKPCPKCTETKRIRLSYYEEFEPGVEVAKFSCVCGHHYISRDMEVIDHVLELIKEVRG